MIKNYKKKPLILSIVLIFISGITSAAERLTIGTEGAYPPFSQINDKGNIIGFDIDIGHALCRQMEVKCNVNITDWDNLIPNLNTKKTDFVVASMSVTKKRLRAVDFTNAYYSNKLQFIAPKNTSFSTDRNSLNGKIIGVQRNTVANEWLQQNLKNTIEIRLYDTQENAYIDLSSKRLDAVFADKLVSWEWLMTKKGEYYEFKGDPINNENRIAIAVRKDSPLKEKLNEALQSIRKNGTYQKISSKYFPFNIY